MHVFRVAIGLLMAFGGLGLSARTAQAAAAGTTVVCEATGPLAVGVGVDCSLNIAPTDGEVTSIGLVDQGGEYWPCGPEVCRDIGKDRFDLTSRTLTLEVGDDVEGTLRYDNIATIVWTLDPQPVLFMYMSLEEPVVFDGRPLSIELGTLREVDRTFIVVRDRETGNDVERVEVQSPGRDRTTTVQLPLDLPIGRYRVWPCVGADQATCTEVTAGYGVQVIDPELMELLPGHNRPSAERINVVFAGSKLGSTEVLVSSATAMLTVDGPVAQLNDLYYGPMAIEPLASNMHRFNFWYLADELADEGSLLFDGNDVRRTEGFDLDNIQFSVLYGPGYGASDARLSSLWNELNAPPADQLRFGSVRVSTDPAAPLERAATLAHEWGHGIFELRDEYPGFDGRDVLTHYPNCAPTLELAQDWWGTLDGRIDPFVYEVLRARRAAGLPGEPVDEVNLATSVQVGIATGGCYGPADEPTAFRPSDDSLMNSEVPVFGSVNRRRVAQVLSRFSGRGPLESLDALEMACERADGVVSCTGELDRYLDPPDRRVALDGSSCWLSAPVDASSETSDGRSTIECQTRAASGPVVLVMGDQRRSFDPVAAPVATAEPAAESAPAAEVPAVETPVESPDSESAPRSLTWIGIGAVFVLLRVGWTAWRHQR